VQQQLRALDMPQKAIAESGAGVRAFNQAGDIGDDESTKIARVDNTQMRLQRSKRIIRDLRTSCLNG
jgi:hypothetical protein